MRTACLIALFLTVGLSPSFAILVWVGKDGGGDGVSFFSSDNWDSDGNREAPHLAPPKGTPPRGSNINEVLVITAGVPGGGSGVTTNLQLGPEGTLILSGGTLRMGISYGIQADADQGKRDSATIVVSGNGRLHAAFLRDQEVFVLKNGTITLTGTDNPLNNTSVDLSSSWKGRLIFSGKPPAAVVRSLLRNISVDGSPASSGSDPAKAESGDNVLIKPNGKAGAVLSVIAR